ncbi:MAG: hypothetical protein COX20_10390 [Desulfobacterales bacterium CG23_combo_of_CG06-09_8_20_14_all_52_9]|nr:MAG: hypothetical protein COX20_10390 [Desulfobacterales bacterium CG23_combo_of_CG06-09_8_20_14_all_52_9]
MDGQTDLNTLLATMHPVLHESPYVFCSIDQLAFRKLPFEPLATFWEEEGVTLVTTQEQASKNSLPVHKVWACITLTVHSSLSAVGFLASITSALARAGICVNPISAYYHDHLFVPWESRRQAMGAIQELSHP